MSNRIGRYEIQAELGRGGFGQVFRAFDPTVGRLVAIKTLTADGDPDLFRRFRNEAAAAGKLRHNNIVIIYDFGEHQGAPYLVMELLDGQDLERLMADRRSLTLLEKLDIITQAASGLHHAHSHGIVHRDIKPANIMLQRDGVVKIMDFGIALLSQATAARLTPQGSVIGTFPYMAPEQFQGEASDTLTDIFAFGVTCYRLITGVHPFHAPEMAGLMYNIMNKAPEPIRALNPECPESLEQAVFRMLAKDRESRYQSLEDVRFDLEPVIAELRKERVHDLLAEARASMAASRLEEAQSRLRQVLEAEPANRTARELRETLQRLVRENEIRPRIQALVTAGREDLQARHFDDALQKFQSALQLNKSNPELQALIAQAKAAKERAQHASKLTEDAQRSLAGGDLTAARHFVLEAITTDPESDAAKQVRALIDAQIEARERERRLEAGLTQARRLLLLESFDEAIAALDALANEHPDSKAAKDLLAKAQAGKETQERRKRLHAATEHAKTLLKKGQFAEALEALSASRAEFPESGELRDLAALASEELEAQRQRAAVEQTSARVSALVEKKQFDDALDVLRAALAEFPGASTLRDAIQSVASAKSEHERNFALQEAITQSRGMIASERFREAVERVAAYVRAYGDNPALDALRGEAENGLERQRQSMAVRQLSLDARALLDEGQPENATQLLRMGTIQYPDNPDLARLLGEAEQKVEEQRQKEEVSRMISEAESLARSRQFDRALQMLDKGLETHSGEDRLVRCRQAITAGQSRHEKEKARTQVLDDVKKLRGEGRIEDALAAVRAATSEFGEDRVITELRTELESEHASQEKAAEVRNIAKEVQTLIFQGSFISATRMLDEATKRFPNDGLLASLKDIAAAKAKEKERAEAIARITESARAYLQSGVFTGALKVLEDGEKQYGHVPEWEEIRRAALKAKQDYERQQEERAEAAKKQRQEEEKTVQVVRQAEELLRAGKASDAVALLEPVSRELKRKEVSDLLEKAQKAAADLKREQETAAKTRARDWEDARAAFAKGDLERAAEITARSLERAPGDGEFQELRQRIEKLRDQKQRTEAVEKALKEAGELMRQGLPKAALSALRPVATKYPGEAKLNDAVRLAEESIQRQQREEELAKVREQAEALLAKGQPEQAVAALQARFAGASELQALLGRAQKEVEEKRKRDARTAARNQLLAIEKSAAGAKRAKLPALAADAKRVAAAHPGDEELAAIVARIEVLATPPPEPPKPVVVEEPRKPIPWKPIAAGGGALAVIALGLTVGPKLFESKKETPPPAPKTIALQIQTEPEGAAVSVGDKSCTSPDCKLDLTAGAYEIVARLDGYETARRSITIDPANPPGTTTLTLARLAKESPVTDNKQETPKRAKLEIRGAPAGWDVRVPGAGPVATGPAVVTVDVPPGEQVVQLRERGKSGTTQIARRFSAGETVVIGWNTIAPKTPPTQTQQQPPVTQQPPPPPQLTAEQKESQAWDKVRGSTDPDQLEAFLRDNANGAHAQEARNRLDELVWSRTAQGDPRALQAYAIRFPKGAHLKDVQRILDDLSWAAVNKNNPQALQAFISQSATSAHRGEAQSILDKLNAAQQAQEKAKAQQQQQQQAQPQAPPSLSAADKTAVKTAIQRFNDAFVHKSAKELKEIWPGALRDWQEAMNQRGAYFVATLYPAGEPDVRGDRASIRCDLITMTILRGQPQPQNRKSVTVRLKRSGSGWVIEDPRGAE